MKRTLKRGLKDLKSLRRKAVEEKWFHEAVRADAEQSGGKVLNRACLWISRRISSFAQWSARWESVRGKVVGKTQALMLEAQLTCPNRLWGIQLEILQKRLLLTRLETRTKESTPYASFRVEKPESVTKVSIRCESARMQHRPTSIFEWRDWARAYLVGPERWWTTLE